MRHQLWLEISGAQALREEQVSAKYLMESQFLHWIPRTRSLNPIGVSLFPDVAILLVGTLSSPVAASAL